jgi:uncharacterized damage-inducible protein DinB
MKKELKALFDRDLKRLRQEIEVYENEAVLWQTVEGISNSGGNLCLHLMGNLNHFVGAVLGNTGYERDRPAEFAAKDIPKAQLLIQLDQTCEAVLTTLEQLDESTFDNTYPFEVLGYSMTTGYFLIHLQGHLNYHLGQIDYHRRILTEAGKIDFVQT